MNLKFHTCIAFVRPGPVGPTPGVAIPPARPNNATVDLAMPFSPTQMKFGRQRNVG